MPYLWIKYSGTQIQREVLNLVIKDKMILGLKNLIF